MREKEFNKLVDQVTERVMLQILSGRGVCYECGERPVVERVEKLEQEAAKRRRIVDAAEVVRCKDCRFFKGDDHECPWGMVVYEDDYCSHGERRKTDGTD